MAFIPFFDRNETAEFSFLTNKSEFVVTVRIGYDDQTDITYSLMVCLSPPGGGGDGEYELVFCLIEYDHDEECEYQIWDGLETRHKIPERDHRDLFLVSLCQALEILIDQASPKVVSMCSYSPHLPNKALGKLRMAADVFSDAGFTVCQPDPYHGRHIWLMERVL